VNRERLHSSVSVFHSQFSILNSQLLSLALLVLIFVSCGAAPKSSTTRAPASGPAVVLPSGASYRVEIARNPEEQAQGLMFREALPEKTGMLFLFDEASVHKFWMKNTMIPLDIVWMDVEGKVLFVSSQTPPCRSDPCPTYGPELPAASVLEIAGGMAKREKVDVGSVIHFVNTK
jgi:uncharacterized protein